MTKENQIDFIAAHNGGIQLFANNGIVGFAKTADALAYMLKTKGFGDVYHSSSMDFADEEGFENADDARILMEEGFKLMEMTKVYA